MIDSVVVRSGLSIFAVVLLLGCDGRDAPKIPLGQAGPGAGEASAPAITGEARTALDSANALFRVKAYDRALAQYRRSAALAPAELAPLLGVLMVAEATKDTKLAERTRARIRQLDPAVADSSAMGHAELIELHSRTRESEPASP